jgi:hypothetical protein
LGRYPPVLSATRRSGGISPRQFNADLFKTLLQEAIVTETNMTKGIYDSRAKDYTNPFRQMVYDTNEEMNKVLGKLEDNTFIQDQYARLDQFKKQVKAVIKKLSVSG